MYDYLNNDPINQSDPLGLNWVFWGNAQSNPEFIIQFFLGAGATYQAHTDSSDPILQDFMSSPGAAHILQQYNAQGNPAFTDKLDYSTMQAFTETVLPHFQLPQDMGTLIPISDGPSWLSVGAQVGGFGGKSKEYPAAGARATRVDASRNSNPKGKYVQFEVINVAGAHSFFLHLPPDRELNSFGSFRTIIQQFKYIVPINPNPSLPSSSYVVPTGGNKDGEGMFA